jgi:Ca-activated chloride channel family protein
MLLNTENTAKPQNRMTGRQIEYLIVAALVAVTAHPAVRHGLFLACDGRDERSKPQRLAGYVRPNDMGTGALLFPPRNPARSSRRRGWRPTS